VFRARTPFGRSRAFQNGFVRTRSDTDAVHMRKALGVESSECPRPEGVAPNWKEIEFGVVEHLGGSRMWATQRRFRCRCVRRGKCRSMKTRVIETEWTGFKVATPETCNLSAVPLISMTLIQRLCGSFVVIERWCA